MRISSLFRHMVHIALVTTWLMTGTYSGLAQPAYANDRQPTPATAHYVDPRFGFSLDYPADWSVDGGRIGEDTYPMWEVKFNSPPPYLDAILVSVLPNPDYATTSFSPPDESASQSPPQPGAGQAGELIVAGVQATQIAGQELQPTTTFTKEGIDFRITLLESGELPEGVQPALDSPPTDRTTAYQMVLATFQFPVSTTEPAELSPQTVVPSEVTIPVASSFSVPIENAILVQSFAARPLWWEDWSYCYGTKHSELYHAAEDWSAPAKTKVKAVANGVVEWYDPTFDTYPGRVVLVRHRLSDESSVYSMYGHLGKVFVQVGQIVSRGEVIGDIANQPLNSHLHWEMRTFADAGFLCHSVIGPGYTYPRRPERYGYIEPSAFVSERAIPSITYGQVLDHQGVKGASAPAGTQQDATPVRPGQVRQAERYWGLRGIDSAGPHPDACAENVDATYLVGLDLGDLAEYLVSFPSATKRYTLTAVGLPDDPQPVRVEVFVDGEWTGQITWDDNLATCNESGDDNSHSLQLQGFQGVHSIAFRFANDTYACGTAQDDACDRDLWFDYFTITEADQPPPSTTVNELRGTVVDPQGNPEKSLYVSLWRQDGGQFLIAYTDASGSFEFHDLDPNQAFNLMVNTQWVGSGGDCGPWQRVNIARLSSIRENVRLTDGGEGWHIEDFLLTSPCP